MALSPRDIVLAVLIIAAVQIVGWPILTQIDHAVFKYECAKVHCE
jgi:hypothetical protein